jgi:hypothetical protein
MGGVALFRSNYDVDRVSRDIPIMLSFFDS